MAVGIDGPREKLVRQLASEAGVDLEEHPPLALGRLMAVRVGVAATAADCRDAVEGVERAH